MRRNQYQSSITLLSIISGMSLVIAVGSIAVAVVKTNEAKQSAHKALVELEDTKALMDLFTKQKNHELDQIQATHEIEKDRIDRQWNLARDRIENVWQAVAKTNNRITSLESRKQ